MIRISQLKMKPGHAQEQLYEKAARSLHVDPKSIQELHIVKRSVDARKKPDILYSYTVDIKIGKERQIVSRLRNPQISQVTERPYRFPEGGTEPLPGRIIVIGAGPAGLFCAYFLAMHGYRPLLLERGKDVDARQRDVETFWKTGVLDPASNVQFGEGGAGTFSDGKLNTLIRDRDGKNRKVLEILTECGAPQEILYDGRPHIGTDILCSVVKNMRSRILSWGGEVRFSSQVTDLGIAGGQLAYVEINHAEKLPCHAAVLAIGHSARNTFRMLFDRQIPMEAKAFAVGLRVAHPQEMIDRSQYGTSENPLLPAASYKLAAKSQSGRGVYSFCMCPGGYIVNASSEPGHLAVNGMSYSGRGSGSANSAIIVSVTPQDYPSSHPLAGIDFQRGLEERAYAAGGGKVPLQTYDSFRRAVTGTGGGGKEAPLTHPCVKGESVFADLSGILPAQCSRAFLEGMEQFGSVIKGFDLPGTLLAGVESRTSSPVRILRDETGQSAVRGIYPCGEGAGYAGGITSAAMDGIAAAEKIAQKYRRIRD